MRPEVPSQTALQLVTPRPILKDGPISGLCQFAPPG